MTVQTMRTDIVQQYLEPVLEAATLLKVRVFPPNVEQLTAVLERLSRHYPQDVMTPLDALQALSSSAIGTVEELDLLAKVWPEWSGSVRYRLTATTLTWQWSSKHSSRYATITVPFPTVLPLQFVVERWCDMDDQANHADECDSDDCHCEAVVEQTVAATVTEWRTDEAFAAALADWLARAVTEPVEPATFPTRPAPARRRKKGGTRGR
jgi:hypothetical protein